MNMLKMVKLHSAVFSLMKKIGMVTKYEIPYQPTENISSIDQGLLLSSKFLLVAAWPKSGSTYLSKLISVLTGYPKGHFVQFYGHNEQDMCEYRIINELGQKKVIHQHVKGTSNNVILIKKYKIKPLVLVRDIFDTVLSVHDHIEKESTEGPGGYIHQQYIDFSFEEKIYFLIKIIIPWYFNFYVSWVEASEKIDVIWLSYEELFSSEKANRIQDILSCWGVNLSISEIEHGIASMSNYNTRLNVGKAGRGSSLPASCKNEIIALAKVWCLPPETFKRIGITY